MRSMASGVAKFGDVAEGGGVCGGVCGGVVCGESPGVREDGFSGSRMGPPS